MQGAEGAESAACVASVLSLYRVGVQVMVGRREAVTLLLVNGRAKDTLGTFLLLE